MNQPWLKGKWNEYKGKAKEHWSKLSDDDIGRVEGRRDQLVGLVQQRYGRSREQAEKDLDAWEKEIGLR